MDAYFKTMVILYIVVFIFAENYGNLKLNHVLNRHRQIYFHFLSISKYMIVVTSNLSFRLWIKWNSISLKIELKSVTTIIFHLICKDSEIYFSWKQHQQLSVSLANRAIWCEFGAEKFACQMYDMHYLLLGWRHIHLTDESPHKLTSIPHPIWNH